MALRNCTQSELKVDGQVDDCGRCRAMTPTGFRTGVPGPILYAIAPVHLRRSTCRSPTTSSACSSRWSARSMPRTRSSPRPCAGAARRSGAGRRLLLGGRRCRPRPRPPGRGRGRQQIVLLGVVGFVVHARAAPPTPSPASASRGPTGVVDRGAERPPRTPERAVAAARSCSAWSSAGTAAATSADAPHRALRLHPSERRSVPQLPVSCPFSGRWPSNDPRAAAPCASPPPPARPAVPHLVDLVERPPAGLLRRDVRLTGPPA